MRKTQDNILAPGNSLFSNPNPRSQLLPHHKTRLSYDSLFAIAESLSCLGHIFPKRIVEDAVYDQTWSKDGTVSFSPSRINFEAVDLLKTSEVITQIDEHGFEFSIRKDPVFQEQMIQQASETCKWEERRWQQLYKMNCKATSFFPQSRYNAMRYIIYSFPEDLQIAALW
jgi:hypothetical protein